MMVLFHGLQILKKNYLSIGKIVKNEVEKLYG